MVCSLQQKYNREIVQSLVVDTPHDFSFCEYESNLYSFNFSPSYDELTAISIRNRETFCTFAAERLRNCSRSAIDASIIALA